MEKKIETSKYEVERPHLIGKNEKVLSRIRNKLSDVIMKEFVGLLPKMYSYLTDDEKVEKKETNRTKKCVLNMKYSLMITIIV